MYISEVELYKKEVLFLGELYDKREVEPIKDFQNMISENNLCLQNVETFTLYQKNDLPIELSILDISLNNRE